MVMSSRRSSGFNAAVFAAALALAGAGLAACGGGGGGGSTTAPQGGSPPPPPPPPPPAAPTWTSGSFAPASQFKDQCEVVRTGTDLNGRAFPDRAGTALLERFWLRSWTNETYLWNTEVADQNPGNFANRRDYFAVLRTFATTASGKDKDDFHFSEPTIDYQRRQNSTPTATYGASFLAIATRPPRDFRVRYTEPNSPASTLVGGQPNFVRGSRLLRVNGIDLVNATSQADVDALNAALFPASPGTTTTFVLRDPGASADRTVTLTSVNLSPKPVNRTRILTTPTGSVGYILFNTFSPFSSEQEIRDAIDQMRQQGVTDLVLDLRYNGGGLLAVASQLSYMTTGAARTQGRAFERLRFNAAAGTRNPVTGETNNTVPFYTTGQGFTVPTGTPLPTLNLPRVFVLSTASTCSASEAVINALRGVGAEVNLIGATTCGKPFGFYPQDNCGETFYTIQFQGVNDAGFGDYADGFVPQNSSAAFGVRLPGCSVADDLTRELGEPNEALLAAALQFRATRTCPTPPAATAIEDPDVKRPSSAGPSLTTPAPGVMEINRDMTMPRPETQR